MKIFLLCFLLGSLCKKIEAQDWIAVGNPGFSAGATYYNSFAIDHKGIPYVAYEDYGYNRKVSVMKYNGSSWEYVGIPGISASYAPFPSISIDKNDTPYLAYEDFGNSLKATVLKYNGTQWVTVGNAGFSAGEADNTLITFDNNNTPYITYNEGTDTNKATVMKYDESNWILVGSAGFTAGNIIGRAPLVIAPDNTPYLAYGGGGNNNTKATVMKYNGSNWEFVGKPDFSDSVAHYISLAVTKNNTLYVAYQDGMYGKATVKKWDGSNWIAVGQPQFSDSIALNTSISIDSSSIPYVAYCARYYPYAKVTAMKYNGTDWVLVGNEGFSGKQASYISIAFDPYNIPYVAYSDYGYGQKATVMKYVSETGTTNLTEKNSFTIYPNPSQGTFTISVAEKIISLQVFDVEGRVVLHETAPLCNGEGQGVRFDLSDEAKGVYFLRTITTKGIINSKLVVE